MPGGAAVEFPSTAEQCYLGITVVDHRGLQEVVEDLEEYSKLYLKVNSPSDTD